MSLRKQSLFAGSLIALLLLALSDVKAQPPGGRGGRGMMRVQMSGLMLLGQKSVQDELKLTEEQKTDATKAQEAQVTAMQGIRSAGENERADLVKKAQTEAEQAVAKILNADQAKRLKQVVLQARGVNAFTNEETAKDLGLTDDQKKEIAKIDEELSNERRGLFQNRDGDRDANRKKMAELTKSAKEKAVAVLTPEQKTKWTDMTGPEFKGEITMGGGGRGGFGGDGGRGGRGGRGGNGPRGERPSRPQSEI